MSEHKRKLAYSWAARVLSEALLTADPIYRLEARDIIYAMQSAAEVPLLETKNDGRNDDGRSGGGGKEGGGAGTP